MVFGGQIARVDVTTPDVPTAEGVRVGDTEARVRAVYGEANVATSPHKYTEGNYLTIAADPAHRLDAPQRHSAPMLTAVPLALTISIPPPPPTCMVS